MVNEYHGILQTNGGNFAMKSTVEGSLMNGKIYAVNGPVDFTASLGEYGLVLNAFGYTEQFFLNSKEHLLEEVDLTIYMTDENTDPPVSSTDDYDYSYSQQSNGQYTENIQTYPSQATADSPYPLHHDQELFAMVAGSQVVYYTRTSYVSDNVSSSITYVNFCENGSFWMNYDGSFSVEGSYGGNAQGASRGQQSGTWQLVTYEGQAAVYLAFNNGETSLNPVNKALLQQGRWKVGNTQYAIQRNKVRCQ